MAYVTCRLRCLARDQGDLPTARRLFARGPAIWRAPGYWHNAIQALEGVGRLAAAEGRPERAVRLIGAAAELRAAHGVPLLGAEGARLDKDLHVAHQELGEARFATSSTPGRSLSLEQATAYALADA